MTIDEVMELVWDRCRVYSACDDDACETLDTTIRAAILALIDAEVEACAELCDLKRHPIADFLAAHIRAARKGGAKP